MTTAAQDVLTVEALAEAKGLDPVFLRGPCGLVNTPKGVGIPYCDEAGIQLFVKTRFAGDNPYGPGSTEKGIPTAAYGLWRLQDAKDVQYLVMVEGESDSWALWSAKIPCLGIPGANAVKKLFKEHLIGIDHIWLSLEPDNGGQIFVYGPPDRNGNRSGGMLDHLKSLGFKGTVQLLQMPDGLKDPSDLCKRSPRTFEADMKSAMDDGKLVLSPPAPGPLPEANGKHGETNGQSNGKPKESPLWDPPAPIGTLPEPMPFPLDALPEPLAEYIHQCAWSTNSPVDFVAVPVLAIAAGCIGVSRRLEIQTEHTQPATLFAAVVGLPGTGKSPSLEKAAANLEDRDARNMADWKRDHKAWVEGDKESRGKEPVVKKLIVDNITTESLCKVIYENQHGLTMIADELSGLVAGMNQYKGGSGNDRQIYQKIWAQTSIRVDRKGKPGSPPPPLVIRRPALSIIGGVNPAVVESFLTNQHGKRVDDGFIDRFLVSYPNDNKAIEEQRRGIEPEALATWRNTVDFLLALQPIGDRDTYLPVHIPLDRDGWDAWVDFTREHAAEVNADSFPSHHRGPWAKLRGYCGRLALVLCLLRVASAGGWFGEPEKINHLDVSRAAVLIDYFKNHHVRVAGLLRTDPRLDEACKVIGWLKRNKAIVEFSRRDAYKTLAHSFGAPDALDAPLALLEQHGYLKSIDVEAKESVGRKPSQKFSVNPLWDREK